jgi:UDP-glucose 4-epimerase
MYAKREKMSIEKLSGQKILITGGAGFIGSHVVDRLIMTNNEVTVYDNLSSGRLSFIEHNKKDPNFKFIKGDLLNISELEKACHNKDIVFHIAANPDVRLGAVDTKVHFDQNIKATYNLLEAMRKNNVKNIAFTSTSTVYGEAAIIPTPENYGPLVPISLYGASKLACEALITSYSHTFDMHSWIFRFANIIGDRGTHGIIVDFIAKLQNNPEELEILGDGRQSKSYLHVKECVDAMIHSITNSNEEVNIFNIGSEDTTNPTRIGEIIVEEMGLSDVKFNYTGGSRGWKGDVPKMMLDTINIKKLGWQAKKQSEESVRDTVKSLLIK